MPTLVEAQPPLALLLKSRGLGDSPLPVSDIRADAKAAGLTWATVRRAKVRLRTESHKTAMGGGRGLDAAEGVHLWRSRGFALQG